MTITTDELARLRAVAEAATSGEWLHTILDPDDDRLTVANCGIDNSGNEHVVSVPCVDEPEETSASDDADYIAAFDPPTALALLAELEQARARIRELEALLNAEQAEAEAAGDAHQALAPPPRGWGRWRAGQG